MRKNINTNQRGNMTHNVKKEYRVEIKSLYVQDVEASSPEDAKRKVREYLHKGNSSEEGAFFYETYDWKNAKVEEL